MFNKGSLSYSFISGTLNTSIGAPGFRSVSHFNPPLALVSHYAWNDPSSCRPTFRDWFYFYRWS